MIGWKYMSLFTLEKVSFAHRLMFHLKIVLYKKVSE